MPSLTDILPATLPRAEALQWAFAMGVAVALLGAIIVTAFFHGLELQRMRRLG